MNTPIETSVGSSFINELVKVILEMLVSGHNGVICLSASQAAPSLEDTVCPGIDALLFISNTFLSYYI